MQKIEDHQFSYYQFELLASLPGVRHFVSSGEYPIGFSESYPNELICNNRKSLAQTVGFDISRMVSAQQVHGTHVAVITEKDAGHGALSREGRIPQTDAMVTACPNICLTVLSADCVPVLFHDPTQHIIAAAHAGWKGTAACIVQETVRTMQETFGCSPADIIACIGPSIGPCCFEVSEDVAAVFKKLYPQTVSTGKKADKYQVDLWETNKLELLDCGLSEKNIEIAGICSMCHPEHFCSYRRDHENAGRFGAGIVLDDDKNIRFR